MNVVTTDDLVQEVRALTSEESAVSPTDEAIARTLTRGQHFVLSQMVAIYPEPLLTRRKLTEDERNLLATEGYIEIPKDAFEDRLLHVVFTSSAQEYFVPWRRFDQVSAKKFAGSVPAPYAVYTMGRRVYVVPSPDGSLEPEIIYVRHPEPLVLKQAQILAVGPDHLVVDDTGGKLSTESDDLESYFNVIDYRTGEVKGTFQVRAISASGRRIDVRSTPQRSVVLGRDVQGASELSRAEPDDFLCQVRGTCVPTLGGAFNPFLVQYAAAELSRSLDEQTAVLSGQISEAYRRLAQQQDSGRSTPLRIKNTSKIWGRPTPFLTMPRIK